MEMEEDMTTAVSNMSYQAQEEAKRTKETKGKTREKTKDGRK